LDQRNLAELNLEEGPSFDRQGVPDEADLFVT
jgi:hypothetical protein